MSKYGLSNLFVLALLAVAMVTSTSVSTVARAQNGVRMFVDPASMVGSELAPCSNFTVTINVSDVVNFFTWQVRLWFDPAILECTDAYYPLGNVFEGNAVVPTEPQVNNTGGVVLYGCTLLLEPVNVTSGALCAVEFHVLDRGSCSLMLDEVDSFLLGFDPGPCGGDMYDIPADLDDAIFDNRLEVHDVAVISVLPSSNSTIVGESLTVDVTVENQGSENETFDVTVYYNGVSFGNVSVILDPGVIDVLPFVWNTTGVVAGNYVVSAEASIVEGETDTEDNFLEDGEVEIIEVQPPPTWIPATVNIHPETLNLKSKGRWITCIVELPEDYDVRDIDISTILLNDTIPAERHPTGIEDEDGDGIQGLMVKFRRAEVISWIATVQEAKSGDLALKVTGELCSGTEFEGIDMLRFRMPGDVDCNGKVDMRDVGLLTSNLANDFAYYDVTGDGRVDLNDVITAVTNFGKIY